MDKSEDPRTDEERKHLKQFKHTDDRYRQNCKEIKSFCKRDKRRYLSDKCGNIERYMASNQSRLIFDEIESKPRLSVMKDARGKTLTE